MRQILIFLFFALLFKSVGCKSESNKKKVLIKETSDRLVEKYFNKEIELLADELFFYNPNNIQNISFNEISNASNKIIIIIDGSCDACISKLKWWNKFISDVENFDVKFLIIIESDSGFSLFEWMMEQENIINYPVFLNDDYSFSRKNKIPSNNNFKTFLVDSNNKILLIGDPYNNKKMEELYLKIIK